MSKALKPAGNPETVAEHQLPEPQYIEHVHKLVELADRFRVHVPSLLRTQMFTLQDDVRRAMRKAGFIDPI